VQQSYALAGVGVHVVEHRTEGGVAPVQGGRLGEPGAGEVQGELTPRDVGAGHGELGAFGGAFDAVQRVAGHRVLAGRRYAGDGQGAGGDTDHDGAPGADPPAE
jgi:hypothetical protein